VTGIRSRAAPRGWKPVAASVVGPRTSLVLQSLLPDPNRCLGTSPHQQGRDTKMAKRSFCGIDVAKHRLDVMVLPEELCWSVANDAAGWGELVARLRGLRTAASGIEASGGYERGVVRATSVERYYGASGLPNAIVCALGERPITHSEQAHLRILLYPVCEPNRTVHRDTLEC
jgi:hypothetical protein